jgi:hypothetical protein
VKALIFIAIAGAAGWWIYKNVFEADTVTAPTCRGEYTSCQAACRKSSTEAPQMQACQDGCQQKLASCEAQKR